jgi:hypothetical protein
MAAHRPLAVVIEVNVDNIVLTLVKKEIVFDRIRTSLKAQSALDRPQTKCP